MPTPLRVAIIGCGPSGFYAADAILKKNIPVEIAMIDRLPAPFGLVRYGVAPDHPKIKNVTKVFEKVLARPEVRFYGNVSVGIDFSISELKYFFDALIFSYGAESDNRLGIPGEDLPGSHTATEFVAWYNGHPDYRERRFNLTCKSVAIIGQGNVAMDVGRILAKTPDELKTSDIAQHALDALAQSKVEEIHIIGRRGPAQSAFTTEEIREFAHLTDAAPIVRAEDLVLNPASRLELEDPKEMIKKRNYETLQSFLGFDQAGRKKKVFFHFFKSPKALQGTGRVQKILLEQNVLQGEAGSQRAKGTGRMEMMECGMVFRSVGYKGVALPGLPFDEFSGTVTHQRGRIYSEEVLLSGFYTAGWVKRGSSGVVGTNKPDSEETVTSLMEDLPYLKPCAKPETKAFEAFLAGYGIQTISFEDWQKIDAEEIRRGQAIGKPREKFVDVEEMLKAAEK